MRRKMLCNALARSWGREHCAAALDRLGIAPTVRPEELSTEQWLSLYRLVVWA
jgi:16S rRNA A1518/A1519 N6-dimethyltransferase RsmA/KsgA/DIM1 with predicted DNA glycosylase/AP lyase activity